MDRYYNAEMETAIAECIHSDRRRLILRLKFIDGWTAEQISAHPDVDRTPRQITAILKEHRDELMEFIQTELRQQRKIS